MKAERRHELKHNELADWLAERMEIVKPHANGVLLGLGLLVLIVLGGAWYFSGETASAARAWNQYFYAFNEREPQKVLQSLADERAGSKAAWWALAAVGDMNLGEGAALLHSDRNEAKKKLEAARDAYLKVEATDDPMLRNRARLGLGKVYESLCQPEEALKLYEQVAAAEKDSAIGKSAAADAKRMKDSREREFLAWFANQTPKRPAAFPGVGGATPGLPTDLPERPDIGMPKGFLDNIGSGTPPEPAPTFPAPSSTTPAPDVSAKPDETPPPAAPNPGEQKPD